MLSTRDKLRGTRPMQPDATPIIPRTKENRSSNAIGAFSRWWLTPTSISLEGPHIVDTNEKAWMACYGIVRHANAALLTAVSPVAGTVFSAPLTPASLAAQRIRWDTGKGT